MIKHLWLMGRMLVLSLVLLVGLVGCGGGQAPPTEIITQAVTQQAERTQLQLWQGLSRKASAPELKVNKIKPTRTRSMRVNGEGAYQIEGNYQLELRYSSRRVKQKAPFEVILQAVPGSDDWRWIYTDQTTVGQPPQWHIQRLQRDRLPSA